MRALSLKWDSQCVKSLECVENIQESTAVTVGNFDGIHLGHRFLIEKLKEEAKKRNLKTLVLSFHPHPLKVLSPKQSPCELTNLEEKLNLLEALSIDYAVFIRFDEKFSLMKADDFIREILYKRLSAKFLLVGYDWRFGYRREGEIELAKELGEKLGFEVMSVEPFKINGHIVSSTLIRRLLHSGRLEEAQVYLGRHYWVKRKVVKGDGRGSSIGVPTANLEGTENLCLKEGVYAVLVEESLLGVANYGYRPTFGGRRKVLEVHILDFNENLRSKKIKVEFVKFLREEKKFNSLEELKKQIKQDIELTRSLLLG
ncbi:riboflavin biosynthesis protein RibF [Hydrogenobacter thermophilus TK-6]|uniref:Riboflavin biosynthesis protein n=2 Tax=Hydrogenobacter thermophilus TaxID=940 RepID=D3DG58_HYDTT|nr:riboflavin biosynthesis protein RibF [Hydrogenobacter thermophilus TK-6]BAI68810.1 riboflavin kinase [Hydrogenobacter thermophilus TK-6]